LLIPGHRQHIFEEGGEQEEEGIADGEGNKDSQSDGGEPTIEEVMESIEGAAEHEEGIAGQEDMDGDDAAFRLWAALSDEVEIEAGHGEGEIRLSS
jgi:hypothetical protein